MDRRLYDHLVKICPKVYYQPPESIKIEYPCIIYHMHGDEVHHADNMPYKRFKQYSCTYITRSATDLTADQMIYIPHSEFSRAYTTNGLHHTVYYIYI